MVEMIFVVLGGDFLGNFDGGRLDGGVWLWFLRIFLRGGRLDR